MTKKKAASKQKDLLVVMVLSLVLGAGGGYAVAAANNDSAENKVITATATEKEVHQHGGMYMVGAENAPKVALSVSEDAKSGYNVKIIATDFTFTPEGVNGDNVTGEGHAHLYVDGEKIGRLYSPYYHYSGSFEGTKTFRVTLNANDHSEYAVNGDVIEAEVSVMHDSDAEGHAESHMDSGDAKEEDHMHSEDDDHTHSNMQ